MTPWIPKCAFCARESIAAGPLVEGPNGEIFICQSCAELAVNLIKAEREETSAVSVDLALLKKRSAEELRVIAVKWAMSGWYRKALRLLELAAQEHPKDINVYRDLGRTYMLAGNPNRAIDILEKAKTLGGGSEIDLELKRARQLVGQAPKPGRQQPGQV
jgi:tetratricopeptide (TPR) repeat protein